MFHIFDMHVVCVSWNILSWVDLLALKPACFSFILLFCSAQFVNLFLIIDSNIFDMLLVNDNGL